METERLTLRPTDQSDLDLLDQLHADAEVMRYLDPEPVEVFLADGFYAAVEKRTGKWLGWFELKVVGDGVVELGYRLRRDCWGRGYATEGGKALIAHGFREGGVQRIVATTMAVNAGSRRVMEKCGLRFARLFHVDWADPLPGSEEGEVEYALTREEWERELNG